MHTYNNYNIILYPTYDVDQSYRQGNIIPYCPVAKAISRYCPVVQLTTTGTWPSGQTQTPYL